MLSIVPFDDAHAPAFFAMNKAWIEENFTLEPLDIAVLSEPRKYIIDAGGEIWCAVKDGKAIGCYALLHIHNALGEQLLEFTKFAVDAQYRGEGAGKALFAHALARARTIGVPELILYTSTHQARAVQMYYAAGFVSVPMDENNKARYARANLFMRKML